MFRQLQLMFTHKKTHTPNVVASHSVIEKKEVEEGAAFSILALFKRVDERMPTIPEEAWPEDKHVSDLNVSDDKKDEPPLSGVLAAAPYNHISKHLYRYKNRIDVFLIGRPKNTDELIELAFALNLELVIASYGASRKQPCLPCPLKFNVERLLNSKFFSNVILADNKNRVRFILNLLKDASDAGNQDAKLWLESIRLDPVQSVEHSIAKQALDCLEVSELNKKLRDFRTRAAARAEAAAKTSISVVSAVPKPR